MDKYPLMSMALSVFVVVLLPLHQNLIVQYGQHEWLNMLFGLPIGIATALNIEIVRSKIRRKK